MPYAENSIRAKHENEPADDSDRIGIDQDTMVEVCEPVQLPTGRVYRWVKGYRLCDSARGISIVERVTGPLAFTVSQRPSAFVRPMRGPCEDCGDEGGLMFDMDAPEAPLCPYCYGAKQLNRAVEE